LLLFQSQRIYSTKRNGKMYINGEEMKISKDGIMAYFTAGVGILLFGTVQTSSGTHPAS
jgi:hypothetical protein